MVGLGNVDITSDAKPNPFVICSNCIRFKKQLKASPTFTGTVSGIVLNGLDYVI
jgi:hypothetical protein